jgi:hypothetical protein
MRRTPIGFQGEEDKLLEKMLASDVVEPSDSDWASPSVLVRKKDGSVRWCVDFRAVNAVTIKDAYPLPNIGECIDNLSGSEFFSTLDMASGYWQVEVKEEDRPKTAFLTKHGLYQFKRMPFGLCNSPSTFQRVVHSIFRKMSGQQILTYLDDIMILGKGFHDHLQNLAMALDQLRAANLKLKPKKCSLFQVEVLFLGKMVGKNGVSVNPGSIQAVQDRPVPRDVKELQSFLGLANYHREHIAKFAEISAVLYTLTKPKVPYDWRQEHQEAFEGLKAALVKAPVLGYPKDKGLYILDTDASHTAIGAELLQIQDGKEVVISYGSYVLTPAQRRYCTTRKELLAVVRFTRQFRHYLLGRNFVIRTDHNSLTWLMRFKYIEGQLSRWLEEVQLFDMSIQHRPGRLHENADSLSRSPDTLSYCDCYHAGANLEQLPCGGCAFCSRAHHQWRRFEDDVDDVVPLAVRSIEIDGDDYSDSSEDIEGDLPSLESLFEEPAATGESCKDGVSSLDEHQPSQDDEDCNWLQQYTPAELRRHQLEDKDLKTLLTWVETEYTPQQFELQLSSPAVKRYWQHSQQLAVREGVLYYQWERPYGSSHETTKIQWQLLVPASLREEVMQGCHDSLTGGHLGQQKTYQRVQRYYTWYEMATDVQLYVRTCGVCNRQKKPSVKPRAALGRYHAGAPMERIHIDMLGPLTQSYKGNFYVLLLVDQFTKWVEIHPLPEQSAEVVARTVVDQVFSRFGCPLQIHSDQGRNFDGNLFKAVCHLYRTAKTRTTPYRPCSNGQVERYNRLLLQMIRCFLRNKSREWDENIQLLAAAIRATPNRQTGFSANLMFLGREVYSPVDVVMGMPSVGNNPDTEPKYVERLRSTIQEVGSLAREKLGRAQETQKRWYDSRLKQTTYDVGDVVYKLHTGSGRGENRKLKPAWIGPLLVTKVLSPYLYRVKDKKREQVLHHDRLKSCQDRSIPMWLRRMRHDILQLDETLAYEEEAPEDITLAMPALFQDENNVTDVISTEEVVEPELREPPRENVLDGTDTIPLGEHHSRRDSGDNSIESTGGHSSETSAERSPVVTPVQGYVTKGGKRLTLDGAEEQQEQDETTCGESTSPQEVASLEEITCGESTSPQEVTLPTPDRYVTRTGRRTQRPPYLADFYC